MIIAQSFRRKAIVTIIAAGGFASLYETTILDSKYSASQIAPEPPTPPGPGEQVPFSATAYCKGMTTASGVAVRTGIAAADPSILPVGSIIDIAVPDTKYSGMYTVLDTGPAIKGRLIDIYMWSCYEALDFGRTPVQLTVMRLGWNPKATTPTFFERLFKRPAAPTAPPQVTTSPAPTDASAPLPSRPLPQALVQ